MADWIVHICPRGDWQNALARGVYRPEDTPERGGFIHACRPAQALRVANAFFRGQSGLVMLWIDPAQVQAEIRWEAADEETFPHIYGTLNLNAVTAVSNFKPDEDCVFRDIPEM